MQKLYANKFQKPPEDPLRNTVHGNKRENRAWNAMELLRFVEISVGSEQYVVTKQFKKKKKLKKKKKKFNIYCLIICLLIIISNCNSSYGSSSNSNSINRIFFII